VFFRGIDYVKSPAKYSQFSGINEGYVSLKKAAKTVCAKICAKMHKFVFCGGVQIVHTKKRAKREGLYFLEPATLYSTKSRFFSTQGIFLFFETNATLRVLKTKKAQFQFKFIPHFVNAPSKFFVILKNFSCKSIKFTPSALSHKSTSTELVSMAGCV